MIAFVTTLRHPANAHSYERVCRLLERTLRSVGAQSDGRFTTVVVCNEPPAAGVPPGVRLHVVDLPPASDGSGKPALRDKGLKYVAGVADALSAGATHVMLLDADDLVHRDIAAFAAAAPEANGWCVEDGWAWWEGSGRVTAVHPFQRLCGSSHIVAARLLAPAFAGWDGSLEAPRLGDKALCDLFARHTSVAPFFADRGTPLAPLPFPGAVWVRGTGENSSISTGFISILGRPIDGSLRADFALDAAASGLRADCAMSARQAVATWRAARERGLGYALRATVGRLPLRAWQAVRGTAWQPREGPWQR